MKKLTTRDIVERLKLEVISGEAGLDREITTEELLCNLRAIFHIILHREFKY